MSWRREIKFFARNFKIQVTSFKHNGWKGKNDLLFSFLFFSSPENPNRYFGRYEYASRKEEEEMKMRMMMKVKKKKAPAERKRATSSTLFIHKYFHCIFLLNFFSFSCFFFNRLLLILQVGTYLYSFFVLFCSPLCVSIPCYQCK